MAGIRASISASLASQLYAAAVAIIFLPVYVKYMGPEAYGLVGFFTMAQAIFQLLDLGVSPMVMRYVARYRGGSVSYTDLRRMVLLTITLATSIACVGSALGMGLSGVIATRWLQSVELGTEQIAFCLLLMAPAIGLRFVSSLLRSIISGFEALVLLGWLTISIATLRFVCVIPAFWILGSEPSHFFAYQLCVAGVEVGVLALASWSLIRRSRTLDQRGAVPVSKVSAEFRFALVASVTGLVWVLTTQLDKMLLSSILPLDSYGYYTLCVTVANGVLLLSSPIGGAILPRMVKLHAEYKTDDLFHLYQRGAGLALITTGPVIVVLTLFSKQFLAIWTDDQGIADSVQVVLALYAGGTAFLVASSFQYLLQLSFGSLRLHLVGNLAFACVLIPSIAWAAANYGMIGAAAVWLVCNAMMFLIWTPIVHARFMPGRHWRWVFNGVVRTWIPVFFVGLVFQQLLNWPHGRLQAAAQMAALGVVLLIVAFAASHEGARFIRGRLALTK